MSENQKSGKKAGRGGGIWLIVAGALGGILLAPASGRETRQTIANDVDHGRKYLVSLARDTRQELGHIADSGKRIARRTREKTQR